MNPDPIRAPETDDEPWDCAKGDDPLAPARGCFLALPLGCLAWVAFFGGLALLVSRILR